MSSYRPLRPTRDDSPPGDPSSETAPFAANDQLDLDGYGQTKSRSSSPQPSSDYNSFRYSVQHGDIESSGFVSEPQYRLYKRRFFGLLELTLLNLAIGWGSMAPSVVSTTAKEWYGITYPELNNLNIASLLVFLVGAPFSVWILNKRGPKVSILIACVLTVIGNWIVYAVTRTHSFPANIAGSIISALASPFVLAAPTRYSRLWFGDRGRTFATAAPSLAYPLGVGIGATSGPDMVKPVGPLG